MYHNLSVREREVMTQKVLLGSVRHIVVSQFCLFHSGFKLRVWFGIKTTKHPLSFHLSPRCSCYGLSSLFTGSTLAETKRSSDDIAARTQTTVAGHAGERLRRALQKLEERKRKREKRRQEWNELYAERPDDTYESPIDVAAIKEAKENIGDYKLKSADDYVVPDHLRMNTVKARSKLLKIKELVCLFRPSVTISLST